ncbi:MAG: hypothetical protein IJM23_09835 [Lachnospiraceae bacterium]|nr:hypothetical protein [Lachnospiraceae bacterium]
MKSIMHDKRDGTCYLCMAAGDYTRKTILEEHHAIHGTANRRLSEKWGLKVYLCPAHHRRIHDSKDGRKDDLYIQRAAQDAFRERYPHEDFRQIFGKNILADDTLPSVSDTADKSCLDAQLKAADDDGINTLMNKRLKQLNDCIHQIMTKRFSKIAVFEALDSTRELVKILEEVERRKAG